MAVLRLGRGFYRSVEGLSEVLESGRYLVEGEELEVSESLSRVAVVEILQLFRGAGGTGSSEPPP